MRSQGFSDTESSSSDSEDDREIAATAASAIFSGTDERDARGRHRPDAFRPGNAVKAFKDWHIFFSGSSSDGAEEFLERIREMQRYYCLTERALQWFRSVGRDARSLDEFERHFRERFVRKLDREDIYDDLRTRRKHRKRKSRII